MAKNKRKEDVKVYFAAGRRAVSKIPTNSSDDTFRKVLIQYYQRLENQTDTRQTEQQTERKN